MHLAGVLAAIFFLLVPLLYLTGVRAAIERKDQLMIAIQLAAMAAFLRVSLHLAGVPALPLF